jgi:phage terminase small subunit
MARTQTLERPKQHTFPKRGNNVATPVEKSVRKYLDTSDHAAAELIDPNKPLTAQQLAFAQAWATGESISSAALRAGYSQDSIGYRLIRMPNVRRAYDREKVKYEEACQMTRKRVMDMLIESFDMAKLMAEPASMVSAAREIGKMCGYYEPVKLKMDVSVNGEVAVRQLNAMSDAELLKLITGGTQAVLPAPTVSTAEDEAL